MEESLVSAIFTFTLESESVDQVEIQLCNQQQTVVQILKAPNYRPTSISLDLQNQNYYLILKTSLSSIPHVLQLDIPPSNTQKICKIEKRYQMIDFFLNIKALFEFSNDSILEESHRLRVEDEKMAKKQWLKVTGKVLDQLTKEGFIKPKQDYLTVKRGGRKDKKNRTELFSIGPSGDIKSVVPSAHNFSFHIKSEKKGHKNSKTNESNNSKDSLQIPVLTKMKSSIDNLAQVFNNQDPCQKSSFTYNVVISDPVGPQEKKIKLKHLKKTIAQRPFKKIQFLEILERETVRKLEMQEKTLSIINQYRWTEVNLLKKRRNDRKSYERSQSQMNRIKFRSKKPNILRS